MAQLLVQQQGWEEVVEAWAKYQAKRWCTKTNVERDWGCSRRVMVCIAAGGVHWRVCHAQCMFIGLAKEMRPKTSNELFDMSGRISVRVTKQYNTVEA